MVQEEMCPWERNTRTKKKEEQGDCLVVQLEVPAITSGPFPGVVSTYGNMFKAVFLPIRFVKGAERT